MFVVMCDNNKYLKDGAILSTLRGRFRDEEAVANWYASRESYWYTDDINKARVFDRKASASCAAARGPLGYSVLEVEHTVTISVKVK